MASLIWLALGVLGYTTGGGVGVVFSLREIIPGLLFAGFLYEHWGWRLGLLRRPLGLVTTPVVIGTWKGELQSHWDDGSGKSLAPFTVYLAIRQTLTTAAPHLLTPESTSVPIAGGTAKTEAGFPAIAYLYRNRPGVQLRHVRSDIHYGGAMIEIIGDPATGLDGEYWTDRKTVGSFRMRSHCPEIAQTYEAASALPYGEPKPVGVFGGLRRRGP